MDEQAQPTIVEKVGEAFLRYLWDEGLVVIGRGDAGNSAAIIREHDTYAETFADVAQRLHDASEGVYTP